MFIILRDCLNMKTKRIHRPKKLKIRNEKYDVVSRSKSWGDYHQAYGMIKYNDKLIQLAEDQAPAEMANTLLHEMLHAIIHEYEIGIDGRSEERIVRTITDALTEAFSANPNLVTWIQKRLKRE